MTEGSLSWTFSYDTWGYRWVSAWAGMAPAAFTPTSVSWCNSKNRLRSAEYDEAGNQKAMGSFMYAYDAVNRTTSSTIDGTTTTYVYDGEGRRVKKTGTNGTSAYLYDAQGRLAAEYRAGGAPPAAGVVYLTADHLGSTRAANDRVAASMRAVRLSTVRREDSGRDQ